MLYVAGMGNFGREVYCWLKSDPAYRTRRILALSDVPVNVPLQFKQGYPTIWWPIKTGKSLLHHKFIATPANPGGRAIVVGNLLRRKAEPFTYAHPHTVIARTAQIGAGVIVCPMSIVSADASVGNYCIVNVHCSVGHDVQLGAFCTLSSHVDLCGHVTVGEGVFFGSGARVLPGVKIGDYARIGAGAVVVRDVPAHATMMTAPARRLK